MNRDNAEMEVAITLNWNKFFEPKVVHSLQIHGLRARRNEVTAKNTNNRATATAMAMSQRATSRVQARSAAFSQPSARTAKTAPVTSWKSCLRTRQRRRKPPRRVLKQHVHEATG